VFLVPGLDWDNRYYVATLDGRPYAYLHVQTALGQPFAMLHLTLLHFSRRVLAKMLYDYENLRLLLRDIGVQDIFLLKDPPFGKWERLLRLLGFGPVGDVLVGGNTYRAIVMEVH
jgi:hypothetical protein